MQNSIANQHRQMRIDRLFCYFIYFISIIFQITPAPAPLA